jgi:hypothetical protein
LTLFVGIAGSLVDSVQLGDVVVATRVGAYHGGKQVAEGFMARPVTWPAAWPLEQGLPGTQPRSRSSCWPCSTYTISPVVKTARLKSN